MEGILYLTDEHDRKRFVQIDLERYGGAYLEEFLEGLVAASRRDEDSEPLADVLAELDAHHGVRRDEVRRDADGEAAR